MIKISEKEINNRLPSYIVIKYDTFIATNKKAVFIDLDYGEYSCLPSNAIRGNSKHPKRKFVDRVNKSIQNIKSKLPDDLIFDESTFVNYRTKIRVVDSLYGEWWVTPSNLLNGQCHPDRANDELSKKFRHAESHFKQNLPDYISIDYETFVNCQTTARFIDSLYGEWWAKPMSVLAGKNHPIRAKTQITSTNIQKYGYPNPMQNASIAKKSATNMKKSTVLNNWFDGLEVVCIGSYEKKVVEYLNINKIRYIWQIPFDMPDGRVYICDLFLINSNTYIEIKGYFRGAGLEKWTWFNSIYKNSELWNKEKLKSLDIL